MTTLHTMYTPFESGRIIERVLTLMMKGSEELTIDHLIAMKRRVDIRDKLSTEDGSIAISSPLYFKSWTSS